MTDYVLRLGLDASPARTGASVWKQATQEVETSARGADRSVGTFEAAMRRTGQTANTLGPILRGLAAGIGAVALFTQGARAIVDFDEAMRTLQGTAVDATAALGVQEKQLEALRNAARESGATTRFTASQSAEALIELTRAGQTGEQAIKSLPAVLSLAQVGLIDLKQSAETTAGVLNQFRLEASEAPKVVDTLAIVANRSGTDVADLGQAMVYAGTAAGALKIPLRETASALGVLSDVGLKASLGGTALRQILLDLANPTAEARREIESLGLSLDQVNPLKVGIVGAFKAFAEAGLDASEAVRIFDARNVAGAIALAEGTKKLDRLSDAAVRYAGEAQRLQKLQDDSIRGSIKGVGSAFEDLAQSLGERVQPAWQGLLGIVRDGLLSLSGARKELDVTSVAAHGLATALGGIAVGGTVALLGKLAASLNPIALGFAAIGAAATLAFDVLSGADEATAGITRLAAATDSLVKSTKELAAAEAQAIAVGDKTRQAEITQQRAEALLKQAQELRKDPGLSGQSTGLANLIEASPTKSVVEELAERLSKRQSDLLSLAKNGFQSTGAASPLASLTDEQTQSLRTAAQTIGGIVENVRDVLKDGIVSPEEKSQLLKVAAEYGDALKLNTQEAIALFESAAKDQEERAKALRTEALELASKPLEVKVTQTAGSPVGAAPTSGEPIDIEAARFDKRVRQSLAEGRAAIATFGQAAKDIFTEVVNAAQARAAQVHDLFQQVQDEHKLLAVPRDERDAARAAIQASRSIEGGLPENILDDFQARVQRFNDDARKVFEFEAQQDQFSNRSANAVVDGLVRGIETQDWRSAAKSIAFGIEGALQEVAFQPLKDALKKAFGGLFEGIRSKPTVDVQGAGNAASAAASFGTLQAATAAATGGLASLVTAATAAAAALSAIAVKSTVNAITPKVAAEGQVFRGFASGGFPNFPSILTTPTVFPLQNGGFGVAAEKAPEVVAPLVRTKSGKLGIEIENGGGQQLVDRSTVNIYVQSEDGARRTARQLRQDRRIALER